MSAYSEPWVLATALQKRNKKKHSRAGKMAQWVRVLIEQVWDLNSNPKHLCKKREKEERR